MSESEKNDFPVMPPPPQREARTVREYFDRIPEESEKTLLDKKHAAQEEAEKLQIPVRTTRLMLYELTQVDILSKVIYEDRYEGYQVALPPERITPVLIMKAFQNEVHDEGLDTSDPVYLQIQKIWASADASDANRPILELPEP